jgi:PTS system nitrogen regulatory IIA component
MDLGDLLKPDGVIMGLKAQSKKQLLQELTSRAAAQTRLDAARLFEVLWRRERLSSTGVGRGIAIPHGRVAGLEQVFTMVAKLDQPLDYDSIDGEPVDLVFLLLAPEGSGADHLKALARISRLGRDPQALERLRGCTSRAALYAALTEPLASNAA